MCDVWCMIFNISFAVSFFAPFPNNHPGCWLPLRWHQSPSLDLQLETVNLPCPLRGICTRALRVFARETMLQAARDAWACDTCTAAGMDATNWSTCASGAKYFTICPVTREPLESKLNPPPATRCSPRILHMPHAIPGEFLRIEFAFDVLGWAADCDAAGGAQEEQAVVMRGCRSAAAAGDGQQELQLQVMGSKSCSC